MILLSILSYTCEIFIICTNVIFMYLFSKFRFSRRGTVLGPTSEQDGVSEVGGIIEKSS